MKPAKLTTIAHYLRVVTVLFLTSSLGLPAFADFSSTVLSMNPEGYWQFNETNQVPVMAVATNYGSAGSAADGPYLNGATSIPSPIAGNAGQSVVKFDGVSQRIQIPYNAALNPSSAISVEAWIQPETITNWDSFWYRSVVRSGGRSWGGGYMLMYNCLAGADAGVFKFTLFNSSGGYEVYNTNYMGSPNFTIFATNGVWFHVVGTWSSSDGIGHLYVNGVELTNMNPLSLPTIAYTPTTNGFLRIGGGDTDPTQTLPSNLDPGGVAQVAIYNYELTPSQVLAHYEAGINASSNYSQTILNDNPVGYWKLNETNFPAMPVAVNQGTAGAALDGTYCVGSTPGVAGATPPNYAGLPSTNTAVYLTNGLSASEAGGLVLLPPLRSTNDSTNLTVVALLKRNGAQMAVASILARRIPGQEKSAFQFDNAGNALGYNWDDTSSQYNFTSGLVPLDNQWTLAAMVISPSNTVIYMDTGSGLQAATNNVPNLTPKGFVHQCYVGAEGGNFANSGRRFNGGVDELAVWTNSLSMQDMEDLREAWIGSGLWVVTQPASPRPVMLGGNAKFTCAAAGSTNYMPFTYQLVKDGTPVGAPTSGLVTYSNVQQSDLSSTFMVNVLTNGVASSLDSIPAGLVRWTTPGTYSALVESLGPAAYYRFSAASGNPVYEIANGLDGTLGGSATRTNGPAPTAQVGFLSNNSAMDISSTAYGYATVEGPAIDTQTNTVTITLWFYPTSASQTAFSGLYYSRGLGTNSNNYVGLQIDRSGGEQLSFAWSAAPNPYDWHTGIYVSPDEWNFIAVVVNQTNAAMYDYTATYGWQQATINQTFPPPVNLAVGGVTAIGADPNFLTSRYCKGAFDEVAIFNKALSQDEIYQLASAGYTVNLSIVPIDSSHNQVGWSYGTLQSADSILGPWTPVSGAVVPSYTNTISGDQKYFRAAY